MKSLRLRLLVAILLTALMLWLGYFVGLTIRTTRNGISISDQRMREIADLLLRSLPTNIDSLATGPASSLWPASTPGRLEVSLLSFQVWVHGRLIIRSPGSPRTALNPDFSSGFANQWIGSALWRVYDASDNRGVVRVQVGISRQLKQAALLNEAGVFVASTLFIVVLLGLATEWAIRRAFSPALAMRNLLGERTPFDLTPLPVTELPVEVRPLIESFNGLLEQLDRAVQAERRFVADAAHELRTPLAVLSAHAELALKAPSVEQREAALQWLRGGVERASRLSEQLLDLARLDASEVAPHAAVDLAALMVVVVRDFETSAHQRGQHIAVEAEPGFISGDIDELGILLRNLIDNALRYSGAKGLLAVSCKRGLLNGLPVVCLRIDDDGPGVPEAEHSRIFHRFYRARGNRSRGSGIGLSLVARIASSHAAKIEVGSGLKGRGLGVSIFFPVALRFN